MADTVYTIKPGDTLSGISSSTGVSLQELMRLNNITNPNSISIGSQLKLSDNQDVDDDFTRALKGWDVKNDLGRAEWRDWALSNPDAFRQYYAAYKTHLKNNNFDALYRALYHPGRVISTSGTKMDIGKPFFKALLNAGFNETQALAILANSYHETGGWNRMVQMNGGPARGILLMEEDARNLYAAFLAKNKLADDYNGVAKYIASLYLNRRDIPKTRYDRNGTGEKYTTQQAYLDFNSNDVLRATAAFMHSYERPGKPMLDHRLALAKILNQYKAWFYKNGGTIKSLKLFNSGGEINYLNLFKY